MNHKHAYHHKISQEHKALIFSAVMFCLIAFSAVMAFASTGPIVLGTELNTNGQVEYLCLGQDCDNLF